MGDKMTCGRTAELLPREHMMSTSQGTRLTARIFFPTPRSKLLCELQAPFLPHVLSI